MSPDQLGKSAAFNHCTTQRHPSRNNIVVQVATSSIRHQHRLSESGPTMAEQTTTTTSRLTSQPDADSIELLETVHMPSVIRVHSPSRPAAQPHVLLRIHVIQIFCGVCCMVMGGVALIEEKKFNVAISIISGVISVIAAGLSVRHGFAVEVGGMSSPGYKVRSASGLRFKYENLQQKVSVLQVVLPWVAACAANVLLMARCVVTVQYPGISTTLLIVCSVQMALSMALLISAALVTWLTCHIR